MSPDYSRRSLLKLLAAGIASQPILAACASAVRTASGPVSTRRLARVFVSPERVIRHVAGLRPFRPAGFRLAVESLGDRTLIHNYGHGGGGVSLSWGCAELAAQHALATPHRDAAVLGCGVIGLTTARLLQDRGFTVTIYASELPPDTTSNIAGAMWGPVTVVDNPRRTPEFDQQYVHASRYAFRYFQTLASPKYGVSWRERYSLSATPPTPGTGINALLADLLPPNVTIPRGEHPFGSLHVARALTMHIEPSIFLPAVLLDYRAGGGRVVVRAFRDMTEVRELPHAVIVNCTGLGSRALCGDSEMTPVKGQLTVLAPQPEVDYIVTAPNNLYMMPRQDGIILGGTSQRGEWSLEPDPREIERIMSGHRELFERVGQG
jgi:glycine/D-amino acid oxidase-like deaminating enzyme